MKKLLLLVTLCLTFCTAQAYESIKFKLPERGKKYQVVRIYDGDTFSVLIPGTNNIISIRINSIDAPERRQEFGMYAKLYLETLIDNQPVMLIPLEIDKWGRAVCTVYNYQNQDVALEMLRAGMAWHYDGYDNTRRYIDAAREAQLAQEGLWSRPDAISPQAYRNLPRHLKLKHQ